jgi:putative ABC transport system permease protein
VSKTIADCGLRILRIHTSCIAIVASRIDGRIAFQSAIRNPQSNMPDTRFISVTLGAFALMALLLGSIGLYGVISYSVAEREKEIGVRMALGAQRGAILKLVIGQGMILALTGAAIGLAAAYALTRLLSSQMFGVNATDPLTFVTVALGLIGVALIACYLPARRATKVDPIVALRCE